MKILHVISVIAPRYGGPSAVILPLCEALNRLPGVDIELATTDADGPGRRIDAARVKTRFPIHVFPRVLSERWQYAPKLGRWLQTNALKFDVLHIHALWTYAPGIAMRCARRAGVPYLLRPAGMLSPYTFARRPMLKKLAWAARERAVLRHAAGFHTTSDEERAEVLRLHPAARVCVVPNGIDEAAWSIPPRQRADGPYEEIGTHSINRPIILCLSRLHPVKGIVDLLLPAFARMVTRASLVIAGGADERAPQYETEIRDTVARLGIQNRVTLIGRTEGAEKWALYDLADVFVLPSHTENFGVVVAEAMARSCAVVVTDQVQASSHVRAAGAGLVVGRCVRSLSAALDDLVGDASRRMTMGEGGHIYARKHLQWDAIAATVARMYQDFAGC